MRRDDCVLVCQVWPAWAEPVEAAQRPQAKFYFCFGTKVMLETNHGHAGGERTCMDLCVVQL